jgi:hypothetical protein
MSDMRLELTGWVYLSDEAGGGDWSAWYRFLKKEFEDTVFGLGDNFKRGEELEELSRACMVVCLYEQSEGSVVCAYRSDEFVKDSGYSNYDKIEIFNCNIELAKLKADVLLSKSGYLLKIGEII